MDRSTWSQIHTGMTRKRVSNRTSQLGAAQSLARSWCVDLDEPLFLAGHAAPLLPIATGCSLWVSIVSIPSVIPCPACKRCDGLGRTWLKLSRSKECGPRTPFDASSLWHEAAKLSRPKLRHTRLEPRWRGCVRGFPVSSARAGVICVVIFVLSTSATAWSGSIRRNRLPRDRRPPNSSRVASSMVALDARLCRSKRMLR